MGTLQSTLNRLGLNDLPAAIQIGLGSLPGSGGELNNRSPIDGQPVVSLRMATAQDLPAVVTSAVDAFHAWRTVPAPVRGEFVRRIGNAFREFKADLATIISWEAGKITQEALGEVQEVIDICDFAVGLSRQLHGLTIASERPDHRLSEQWHPLGPIGVISAFNFPMAVWAWNAALAWVCGDPVVWKPSEKTPLSAIACQSIVARILETMPNVPPAVSSVIVGGQDVGAALAGSRELPLISATGSTAMGRAVAQTVAARLGRSLLELGGNNGMIVTPSADLEMAVRAIVFSAVGTCGQRCTTLRRLIVHESLAKPLIKRIVSTYEKLPIGDPLQPGTLLGPLIDEQAWTKMQSALSRAATEGGIVHGGERLQDQVLAGGYYVKPALVDFTSAAHLSSSSSSQTPRVIAEETFAPILYVQTYQTLEQAIDLHNNVPQGLASSIMTNDLREAEKFCSAAGSDCGIVNVNVGPSGAEIGGAFGGEKETGGGRESGSDCWKSYMRRTTNTINFSTELPLAQGIQFDFAS